MKRLFLALPLTLLAAPAQNLPFPGPGNAAATGGGVTGGGIAFVSQPPAAYNASAGVCVTPGSAATGACQAFNTTGANGIYIWATGAALTSSAAITDAVGSCAPACNTYVGLPVLNHIRIWYADNGTGSITVGSGHVLTISNCQYCAWGAIAFSGMKTSGSYDGNVTSASNASGTTVQPGSINPGSGKHLVLNVYWTGDFTSNTWTPGAGYTAWGDSPFYNGNNYDGAASYLIQTPNGSATNPVASFGTSVSTLYSYIASFGGA